MIEISFIFGVAIYGIIWFLTLFMVLPWGVVSQEEHGEIMPGSSESAPAQPRIYKKLLITTAISIVFYALVYWMLTSGVLADVKLPFIPDFTEGRGA